MARISYSDEDKAAFLETASEIGIERARRQLKYPHSWQSGKRWADAAGIELPLDDIKARAAAAHDWYKTEDLLLIASAGLRRAQETYDNADDLSADDQKKLAEAVQKHVNTLRLLNEQATNISESRTPDTLDIELFNLLREEESRNQVIEHREDESYQDLVTV